MILDKEEVEKAAIEYSIGADYPETEQNAFEAGVEFAEEKFKELAVEFANWLFLYKQNGIGEWKHQNRNVIIKTTEELFELFLKERNENK